MPFVGLLVHLLQLAERFGAAVPTILHTSSTPGESGGTACVKKKCLKLKYKLWHHTNAAFLLGSRACTCWQRASIYMDEVSEAELGYGVFEV